MIEIINEKFYNVLNKIEVITEKSPEVADILKDMLELMMLTLERQDDANNHFNTNIMGLAGDVGNLHKEVENNNNCCSQPQQNQSTNKPSDDIIDIASFIMNDDSSYNEYINNKRKESKSFVLKQNPTSDEKSLESNIGVLSNFIEAKLRK